MELDDPLRKRIEAVLSTYASPGREDRAAAYADRITHLAKIAMCVKLELDPPPGPSRKRGERGPSTLALQDFLEGLCIVYADLTGKAPTRSIKHKRFRHFVEEMVEVARIPPSDEKEGYNLDYHVQLACRKYKAGNFIFSSQ
jgi:hypothetical protein